ncbi:transposase [Amycolatopsis sp. lyj-90]|uniref:transposase n=1 Tax=Amycolatopsis sp. lyj-90 TaxID=2789285 RepID=UPI00397ABDC5
MRGAAAADQAVDGVRAGRGDHLGYDKHDPASRGTGNSRDSTRSKIVLTDVGLVEIDVPRDRDTSFEHKIVAKPSCARRRPVRGLASPRPSKTDMSI